MKNFYFLILVILFSPFLGVNGRSLSKKSGNVIDKDPSFYQPEKSLIFENILQEAITDETTQETPEFTTRIFTTTIEITPEETTLEATTFKETTTESEPEPIPPDFSDEQTMTFDDGKYLFTWKVDTANTELHCSVKVEGKGWIGFGISPGGGMTNADIFIGGTNQNNQTYFDDYYTDNEKIPKKDLVNNWEFLNENYETETYTVISFKRKFNTGDADQDKIIEFTNQDEKTKIIWSYNIESDNPNVKHTASGEGTIAFRKRPKPDWTPYQTMLIDYRSEHPGRYYLKWRVDNANRELDCELTVEAKGWVQFGIQNNYTLNTDIVIGGFNDTDKKFYFDDYHTFEGVWNPIKDSVNNWMDVEGDFHEGENGGPSQTIIKFTRKFDTKDPNVEHDQVIEFDDENAVTIITWSYHNTPNHIRTGASEIAFRKPATKDEDDAAFAIIPTSSTLILFIIGLSYLR